MVRALAGALTASSGTIDLFRLTLAVAVAGRLEPDHLVRVLQAPAGTVRDRSPLAPSATEVLAELLADPDIDAALPTGGHHPDAPRCDLPDHPDWELRPHLRRGHVVEFRGRHNRTPAATVQREVVALLDAHDRFRAPEATVRVEITDRSLRRLATRWLAPSPGDAVEWVELGIAFWLAGLLRELPDPDRPAGERVVGDLAELAVGGRLQEVPRRAPGPADLAAAERRLADGTTPRTRAGQQRRAMLAVVRAAVHRGTGRPSRHGHGRQ